MKSYIVPAPGGLDRLTSIEQRDPGAPGPGDLRVRLHATSLNFHDLLVVTGQFPAADGRIPMSDGAGIVEGIGSDVAGFAVGDSVVSCFFPNWQDGEAAIGDFQGTPGDGIDGFAQSVVVRPAHAFTHAPIGWSHAESATITTAGLTAWRALVGDGKLKAGDTVLLLGTGGVSIACLQLAKSAGAKVIITSSSDEKLARAKALGADYGINYRHVADWGVQARELTGGRGVDHVIELGGPGTLAQSIEAVRVGGQISLIGVLTGMQGEVPTAALMIKQARLQGLIVGSRRQQRDYVRALNATGIRPVIDRSYPFDDLAAAFRHLESGAHFGKIVVEW